MGAIAAQLTQAFGSFLLQVIVARELGASGLGMFALLFGVVVLATAVSTGLVGDALTVLDRHDPRIRAALSRLWLIVPLATAIVFFLASWTTGALGLGAAVAFAVAAAAFQAEDVARRSLMASLRFWRVVAVDVVAVLVSLGYLATLALQGATVTVTTFLAALAVGQVAGLAVGIVATPSNERLLLHRRGASMREVLTFGGWRAGQQLVRPSMLAGSRFLLLATAGAAVLGQVEAARVYLAPAMLVVQGAGSYLLASYARESDAPLRQLLRRADRTSATLLASSLLIGLVAALLAPTLGPVITDSQFDLPLPSVVGWAVYSASIAAVMPYASLAAVRGVQTRVVTLRMLDSMLSLLLLLVGLLVLDIPGSWAPWLISVGSFVGGVLCRTYVLVPLRRRAEADVVAG